ncbi:MAG: chemotaxis protein CheR [Geobacteraceae bacterium]|nr:chemotaxis protein CheR [Geobacteraceae bacterium]
MNCSQSRIPEPAGAGLPDELLARLSSHVAAQMGLHFPPAKWQTLKNAFSSAAGELGFRDPEGCANWFMSAPLSKELVEAMAGYLTIGETYFLREKRSFEILAEEIIPEITRTRRPGEQRLRIWSAGCSSGEEAYSLAITLHRMNHLLHGWNISILATDINPQALRKAVEGIYTEWSFRDPPVWLKENYFKKSVDGRLRLIAPIRKMVTFAYLNLIEDPYPSLPSDTNAMDVIFCRNVLMYFTPELARKVVERFHRSLVDGGWLIVSPCEVSQLLSPLFKAVNFRDAIYYQKQPPGARQPEHRGPEPNTRLAPSPPAVPEARRAPPMAVRPQSVPPVVRPALPLEQSCYEEALALYERGLYPQAEHKLSALLRPDGVNVPATVLLCRIRANQGQLADALLLLDQALATDKLNPGLHYLRAMILQEQGADHEAGNSLKRALYLDQNLVVAHLALANLARKGGRLKEYRTYLETALTILGSCPADEILPEAEGMTAGRLMNIIGSMETRGERDGS